MLANGSAAALVEQAVARREGVLTDLGALSAFTGPRTGRSPKDKYTVRGGASAAQIAGLFEIYVGSATLFRNPKIRPERIIYRGIREAAAAARGVESRERSRKVADLKETIREGAVYIQETTVPIDTLVAKLQAITGANPDAVIYVRGDKEIHYGRVLEVMGLISSAGFHKVSLVTEPLKGRPAPARPTTAAVKR